MRKEAELWVRLGIGTIIVVLVVGALLSMCKFSTVQ
jgi:hypothetical protein